MADTYSQINVQIVFAVKGRRNLIPAEHREELHKYIAGIISRRHQKLLAIFAMPDHIHILIGIRPNIAISDLVRDIKTASSKFISEKNWLQDKFNWQLGYGVFSYSNSQIAKVAKYIENQEQRHKSQNFKNEYLSLLNGFNIDYNEEYVFDWIS